MLPTHATRLDRIGTCVSDLHENGIDVEHADDRRLSQLVREHIEYFQLMLGYDSDPTEVMQLLKSRARH